MCAQMCGDQGLKLGIFLNHFPPYFLSQALSLSLEVTVLAGLASQRAPWVLLSPLTQCWDYRCTPHLCVLGMEFRYKHFVNP